MMFRAFDDDWADWQFEHNSELREKSLEMEDGRYVTLDELDRELEE